MSSPIPGRDEALRLSVLAEYAPGSDLGDAALDELVALAAQICEAPIALVTLLGAEHQDFAARVGLDVAGTERDVAFCAQAITSPDEPFVVEDASADPRFAGNPLVRGDEGIRFYAGVPLVGDEQQPLGTLCVLDRHPRTLSEAQVAQLRSLGRAAMAHLEARRVRMALEHTRHQLAGVLHEAPDAYIAMDESGVVRGWNPAAERLFGWTETEALGRRVSELIVPGGLPEAHDAGLERYMRTRSTELPGASLELTARRRDGDALEIELTIGCVERDGRVLFNAFARDIGERKAIERELAHEREFTQAVLETIDTPVVACDAHGNLSLFNRAARELHGVDADGVGATEWAERYDLLEADGRTLLTADRIPLARAFAGERVREQHMVVHRRDHEPRTLSVSGRAISDHQGQQLGAVVAMHDLTDRLAQERARRAADKRFEIAFDAAPIGMVMVALDGTFLRSNAAISKIIGRSAEELAAGPPFGFVHPDDLPEVQERFQAVAVEGSVALTHRIVTADGHTAWVVAQVTLVRDEDGRPLHALAQVNDITEQHLAQLALAEQHDFVTAVIETADTLVVVLDRDGTIATFNRACEQLTGRRSRDVVGRPFWDVVLPREEVERTKAVFGEIVAGDFPHHYVNHWRTVGDDTRLVEWRSTALTGADGAVTHIVGTGIDVTERRANEDLLRASEQELRSITGAVPAGILRLDLEGRWTYVNGRFRELWHLTPEQPFEDFDWLARMHPADRERVVGGWGAAMAAGRSFEARFRVVPPDGGQPRWLFTRAKPEPGPDGGPVGYLATTLDVHEQHLAEQALAVAEQRFRQAFEQAPIGVALVALDGRFEQVNAALCAITGFDRTQLEGLSFAALTHPDDLQQSEDGLAALLAGDLQTFRTEKRYLHASGHPVWVAVSSTVLRDADGSPRHLLTQFVDITERRRFEDRLRHMADHDPLTGLVNRRRFEADFEAHLARCKRYGVRGALLVLDVDHFKAVNDTLGHSAGDELIISVAATLRTALRETDTVARLGGDEFAVLLPEAGHAEAEEVAAKIVAAVREGASLISGERRHRITTSVGVVVLDAGADLVAEQLIVDADLAMYDAKDAGRDRYALFADDEHLQARTKSRLSWVSRIGDAIEHDRFVLEAQPILNLRNEQIGQHELLIRMRDAHGDLIPPSTFLYVAERFGLITDIDKWVTGQAVELLAATAKHARPPVLEANISGHSMGDPSLLRHIEQALKHHPEVDPTRLVLEITETAAIADIAAARRFTERLSGLGCRFALDDFGAGFGSLYYLKHLPFDFLKIDGEFVMGSVASRTDQLVIEAAVGLARGLGKQTIAEFVTDHTTAQLMRTLGVDHAQGYLVGRPGPASALLAEPVAQH